MPKIVRHFLLGVEGADLGPDKIGEPVHGGGSSLMSG
jgi:hypothetical protein